MLEQQAWMQYAKELPLEWRQAMDEGREVEDLWEICRWAAKRAEQEDCAGIALELRKKLLDAPVRAEYPYDEPSGLAGILEARSQTPPQLPKPDEAALPDRIAGAWAGRISGCLLGKPVEGMRSETLVPLLRRSANYPMDRYIMRRDFDDAVPALLGDRLHSCWADTLDDCAPADDDTNYTVLALKLVKTYGPDFRPNDVLEGWLSWLPMFAACTAERAAYRNAAMGMYAPETALFCNPYREWIGAQIRGDFFGYLNPGNPERAAEMAWRDASISHVKNGIYGEMFASAMIAAAASAGDTEEVIRAGLSQIPENCRLARAVEDVLSWRRKGVSAKEAIKYIHAHWDEHNPHDWCHTISNAMIVTMALLYGEQDFGKSVCLAVQSAFDTDCNGATVGSVLGMRNGFAALPSEWYEPIGDKLATSIFGVGTVKLSDMAKKTLAVAKR